MITSIGSSNETLTQILNSINSINTDKSNGVSKKEIGALDKETEFTKNLMECFDAIDKDNDKEVSSDEVADSSKEILSKLGVPAGIQIENSENNSLFSKIKNKFDFDGDGKLSMNDLKAAENKSPLIKNLVKTFEEVSNSTNGGNKITSFFQGMINQYKDNPMNAISDAAKLFA